MKRTLISIIIIIAILLLFSLFYNISDIFYPGWYCKLRGGRISNDMGIVDYTDEFPVYGTVCYRNETNIGSVKGFKCDCICCMPK